MKKSIFAFEIFYSKNLSIFSTNSTTIRIQKKRQKSLQNKEFANYVKIKANDKSAKTYILQALRQTSEYLELFKNAQD